MCNHLLQRYKYFVSHANLLRNNAHHCEVWRMGSGKCSIFTVSEECIVRAVCCMTTGNGYIHSWNERHSVGE